MDIETRNFFCPYCQEACDDFDGLKRHVLANHRDEAVPLPEGVISLTVNGQLYQTCVEPEWTLNYLIHDKMGLTSPKMFCDRGACGSCTVIMNGRPILSFMSWSIVKWVSASRADFTVWMRWPSAIPIRKRLLTSIACSK